ncbi:Gp138 family membrane-puncturing spike protein [Providencia huaxiensis]|uniref:Gp138 family membrane-puncturing spike protein n=1 Tax=Providencia huaxiensis TaxID=2027290 RepID=UPI0033306124
MTEPTLLDVMTRQAENQRQDIHTALPAKVVSCDGHSVTVELMISHLMKDGSSIALPPLVDVPVGFYRGGGFCVTVPLKAGDEGLAIFAERCIDGWYASGNQSAPLDTRFHDLSDAFFFPQGSSQPNKISDYSSDSLSMQTDDGSTYIRMQKGKIKIKGDIEHVGNSEQIGQHEQKGNWSQTQGEAKSTGKISAAVGVFGGVDVEKHDHPDSHGGNTGEPNK